MKFVEPGPEFIPCKPPPLLSVLLSPRRAASKEVEDVQPSGAFDTFLKPFRGLPVAKIDLSKVNILQSPSISRWAAFFFDLKLRTGQDLDIRHVKCASGPTRGSSRKHFWSFLLRKLMEACKNKRHLKDEQGLAKAKRVAAEAKLSDLSKHSSGQNGRGLYYCRTVKIRSPKFAVPALGSRVVRLTWSGSQSPAMVRKLRAGGS